MKPSQPEPNQTMTPTDFNLASFAADMYEALCSLTHPMASDEALEDALALLAEIRAARKSASDQLFLAAALARQEIASK
jgi:hypothetical protein